MERALSILLTIYSSVSFAQDINFSTLLSLYEDTLSPYEVNQQGVLTSITGQSYIMEGFEKPRSEWKSYGYNVSQNKDTADICIILNISRDSMNNEIKKLEVNIDTNFRELFTKLNNEILERSIVDSTSYSKYCDCELKYMWIDNKRLVYSGKDNSNYNTPNLENQQLIYDINIVPNKKSYFIYLTNENP